MTNRCTASGIAAAFALAACTRETPSTTPAPPDIAAPAPARAALSRFSVPLEYDFTPVLAIVERVVPKTFGSMDSVRTMGTDQNRHYAFEATRGPFTAFGDANHLHLRTTLAYSARGYFKPRIGPTLSAGCGKGAERPRITVELATPLTLNASWHLVSRAHVVRVEPFSSEQRDHCDVSFLKKDVTDRVVEAARSALASQLPTIDKQIATVDLTERATEWWAILARPIRLHDDVWLVLGPERLRAGRVSGASKVLTVPVTLDARPVIVTGPTEPVVAPSVLPPLGADTTADGFRIVVDGLIDYGTASRELTSALSEKTFTQSGHSVSVLQATVRPLAKGRLSLVVVFAGDANGKLVLSGTPFIDHRHYVITVPDLDFDLASDNKLLATFAWLKSSTLRDQIRRRSTISMIPALDRGRALLREGLNRRIGDAVTLSATVDSVGVRDLFVTRDGIVVRAEASGRAGMSVRQR